MMDVMNTVDFQTQLTSIMEMLAKTAIVEIGKLFEENSSFVRLEISRCTNQIETLQQKCNLLETELQSARKTASEKMMNGTDDAFTHSTLTETGHRPAINNVFGKEWCMNMWKHEESDVGQKEEKHVDSSVITGESVNLIDDEPDMIMIKEETLEECSIKNKTEEDQSNMLRGPAAASNDRCVAKTSDDFITYRLPSGDQVKSNVQQRQPKKKILDGRHSTHGDNASGSNLNHDEFVTFFPSNVNFNSTQNQTSVLEEKKFDCILCGKTFSYLSYLKVHMRIHSGEKPYACSVCGKRFAQKTYLRIHQRTHSGERPYTCMECGKSFSQKSSLNVHLRSHTGEKPYNCVECGKSYAYKYGFNTHQCAC